MHPNKKDKRKTKSVPQIDDDLKLQNTVGHKIGNG